MGQLTELSLLALEGVSVEHVDICSIIHSDGGTYAVSSKTGTSEGRRLQQHQQAVTTETALELLR